MVKLRLRRTGSRRKACFRIVATDSRSPRDGRFLEILGFYDPRHEDEKIDLERVDYWLGNGAQPSDTVASIIKRARGEAPALEKSVPPPGKIQAPEPKPQTAAKEAPAKEAAKAPAKEAAKEAPAKEAAAKAPAKEAAAKAPAKEAAAKAPAKEAPAKEAAAEEAPAKEAPAEDAAKKKNA